MMDGMMDGTMTGFGMSAMSLLGLLVTVLLLLAIAALVKYLFFDHGGRGDED